MFQTLPLSPSSTSVTQLEKFLDHEGKPFTLVKGRDNAHVLCFKLLHRHRQIGRGKFRKLSPSHYLLCDVKIADRLALRPAWLFLPPTLHTFQGRGLGTRLVRRMLEEARTRGVSRVSVCVQPEDLGRKADLLRWYRHFGFDLAPGVRDYDPQVRLYLDMDPKDDQKQ
jgi:GNAT superfamily N-acetyltransferase